MPEVTSGNSFKIAATNFQIIVSLEILPNLINKIKMVGATNTIKYSLYCKL